jgi:hypothetical protein
VLPTRNSHNVADVQFKATKRIYSLGIESKTARQQAENKYAKSLSTPHSESEKSEML